MATVRTTTVSRGSAQNDGDVCCDRRTEVQARVTDMLR